MTDAELYYSTTSLAPSNIPLKAACSRGKNVNLCRPLCLRSYVVDILTGDLVDSRFTHANLRACLPPV